MECSEPAHTPGVDLLERSPTSVLDISHVKSNHLHQLVSEGNVNGVRLVHFDTHSFTAVFLGHVRIIIIVPNLRFFL